MKFNYQARSKTGEIQSGIVEASSREAAVNVLRSHDLYLTLLEEVSPPFYAKKIKIFDRVSRKEIVLFSRQLSIMFKSEIPLIEILSTLSKQTANLGLREKILNILDSVEGGSSLSKTFAAYPEIFSPFYVNMVKAGEVSGKLSDVFSYLADHLEREYHFYGKIRGALLYPVFVLFVFVAVILAMIFFVMPQMSRLIAETGGELPAVTKILLASSSFLRKWGWVLILVLLFLGVASFFYFKTKEGKSFLDKNTLKVPLLGNFLKKVYLSRVSLNLSTLISGGLPIVQALGITGEVVGNEVYKGIILETAEGVKRGEQISALLERYPKEITPLFIQMIVVGEKTGRLESSLINVVDFYQKETDRSLENFMRLLEPIMIIVFGLLVGGLMAAVIMPLYQIVAGF